MEKLKDSPEINATSDGLIWSSRKALMRLKHPGGLISLKAVRVQSRNSGGYLSRFKGRGMEFDESRPYQPGDDIRCLDWRVTARTGKAHTKIFCEERERAVLLWVDYRTPMHFATRGAFKSVRASQAAAMLAWSARKQGDRLGGLAFSEQGHRELRPQSGDRAVLNMISTLSDYSSASAQSTTPAERSLAMSKALLRLRRVAHPGSLIFMISDFRDLDAQSEQHISNLAQHNDLVLLQIHDPLEADLPTAGWYPLSDGDRRYNLNAADRKQRERHHLNYTQRRDYLLDLCRRYRMHLLEASTDSDLFEVLQQGLGRGRR